ncbi:bifunctional 2',3'-cyclic-nucleotide 2'-phosphodiesterase/3'-nucleotidase [Chitinilyticum aquatile]|uniref:bifunctional 2',3'-cyclic-nucleotide 2'-phosphodiesterase/3'-nucleotidase n=1 Tax=Chitinilyticum aquatile TaxID=362520 RepID=UPI0003FE185A|nr:bifunctional 2',3'-cyclic-nucleotide 2'-phosphodiesterase/3'-nucleotidase [Chitinilyticum aquatile]
MKHAFMRHVLALSLTIALGACGGGSGNNQVTPPTVVGPAEGDTINLAVLETTDLHTNLKSYDYYKTADDPKVGLERTASLINAARKEFGNTLLVDNGDTIQGTPLADYEALVAQLACNDTLTQYKAMNAIGYDIATLGNHEFNYGLDFLYQVTGKAHSYQGKTRTCKGPNFPLVLANVYDITTKQPIYQPWQILERQFVDSKGIKRTIKVGVIGFTPPGIMQWDKRWLEGKLIVEGAKDSAAKYVPEMRKAGADVVVALVHGGINVKSNGNDEDPVYGVAGVPGIDAIVAGHSHTSFPGGTTYTAQDIDNTKGLIKGVPVVQAGFWGSHLGVIKLNLAYKNGKWVTDSSKSQSEVRAIYDSKTAKPLVEADANVTAVIKPAHDATVKYVNTPVGTTELRLSSYLSQIGDTAAIELLNAAQADYVSKYVNANLPQYKNLPVLSAQAPFKGGFAGASDYTDVAAGPLSIRSAADLYLYSNTIYAVKIKGRSLKGWLENSAEQFNTIDPTKTADQELLNPAFKVYNFDIFDGVTYEIDLTQAPGNRIVNLKHNGVAVSDTQEFIVATNNYRASGIINPNIYKGIIPTDVEVLLAAPDANRDVVISYVQGIKTVTSAKFTPNKNWRFKPLPNQAGKVVFRSAPAAVDALATEKISNVVLNDSTADSKGLVGFRIDLTK